MDVILLERIEKLGAIGDVVKVKDGFARNFLLPNKKALRSNAANRKVFEANRARIEAENASRRSDAEKEAGNFNDVSVTLIRQASNTGQLYGSVAVRDLVEAITADGHKVNKSQVVSADQPIARRLGGHREVHQPRPRRDRRPRDERDQRSHHSPGDAQRGRVDVDDGTEEAVDTARRPEAQDAGDRYSIAGWYRVNTSSTLCIDPPT